MERALLSAIAALCQVDRAEGMKDDVAVIVALEGAIARMRAVTAVLEGKMADRIAHAKAAGILPADREPL